jgi:ABC-2 type transport system ATP-binding protein
VFSLYPTLTVQENARFVAGLYGLSPFNRGKRIRYVLDFLGLWDARKRLGADLSGGMQRRLGLACAVLHRPSLLVVDEPTAGLDPTLRARIWEYLHQLQRDGTTIFLTTQYIEEAEHCDSVAVLRDGRSVAVGSPGELRRNAAIPDRLDVHVEGLTTDDIEALWPLPGVREVRRMGDGHVRILADESEEVLPLITEEFVRRGRRVVSIETSKASFEEVFVRLVERARQ